MQGFAIMMLGGNCQDYVVSKVFWVVARWLFIALSKKNFVMMF